MRTQTQPEPALTEVEFDTDLSFLKTLSERILGASLGSTDLPGLTKLFLPRLSRARETANDNQQFVELRTLIESLLAKGMGGDAFIKELKYAKFDVATSLCAIREFSEDFDLTEVKTAFREYIGILANPELREYLRSDYDRFRLAHAYPPCALAFRASFKKALEARDKKEFMELSASLIIGSWKVFNGLGIIEVCRKFVTEDKFTEMRIFPGQLLDPALLYSIMLNDLYLTHRPERIGSLEKGLNLAITMMKRGGKENYTKDDVYENLQKFLLQVRANQLIADYDKGIKNISEVSIELRKYFEEYFAESKKAVHNIDLYLSCYRMFGKEEFAHQALDLVNAIPDQERKVGCVLILSEAFLKNGKHQLSLRLLQERYPDLVPSNPDLQTNLIFSKRYLGQDNLDEVKTIATRDDLNTDQIINLVRLLALADEQELAKRVVLGLIKRPGIDSTTALIIAAELRDHLIYRHEDLSGISEVSVKAVTECYEELAKVFDATRDRGCYLTAQRTIFKLWSFFESEKAAEQLTVLAEMNERGFAEYQAFRVSNPDATHEEKTQKLSELTGIIDVQEKAIIDAFRNEKVAEELAKIFTRLDRPKDDHAKDDIKYKAKSSENGQIIEMKYGFKGNTTFSDEAYTRDSYKVYMVDEVRQLLSVSDSRITEAVSSAINAGFLHAGSRGDPGIKMMDFGGKVSGHTIMEVKLTGSAQIKNFLGEPNVEMGDIRLCGVLKDGILLITHTTLHGEGNRDLRATAGEISQSITRGEITVKPSEFVSRALPSTAARPSSSARLKEKSAYAVLAPR